MSNNTATVDVEITPEAQKLAQESEGVLSVYQNYKIATPQQYTLATDDLKRIKAKAKELEELRKSLTRPLDESKHRIMNFFRRPLELLSKAEGIVKQAMLTFQREEERKRQEKEARLRELARKEEEKKRKQLEEKAKKAEAKGDIEKAEELRQQAEIVNIPTPIVPTETTRIEGIKTRTIWRAEVVDINKLPREYMIPNQKMLQQFAQATKGKIPIPGVKFYEEKIIVANTV